MQQPVMPRPADNGDAGGAATVGEAGDDGGAAGLIDFLGDGMDAALNVLNYATYYQMKERAGLVGRDGVNPLLKQIHTQCPALKMHLIGHSFGGRLVTATAAGLAEDTTAIVHSMTLLQAAFSHHGLPTTLTRTGTAFSAGLSRMVWSLAQLSLPAQLMTEPLVKCTP